MQQLPPWSPLVTLVFYFQCQIDVYIHEKAGINFMEVKGGLSTKVLANAITKTVTDKQVQFALLHHISLTYKPLSIIISSMSL